MSGPWRRKRNTGELIAAGANHRRPPGGHEHRP
jgi:hypothetical protein